MSPLRLALVAGTLATAVGCGGAKARTVALDVGGHALTAEIADTQELRAQGLMHRDSLDADAGMVFVYPDTKPRRFWMKNTRIPLSIAFLDEDGVIVKIADMQPFSTAGTPSLYPARYALETNQGWFDEHGIEAGATVGGLEGLTGR